MNLGCPYPDCILMARHPLAKEASMPSTRGDQLDHPLLQHGLQGLPYSIAKYSTVALRMRFPPNPT